MFNTHVTHIANFRLVIFTYLIGDDDANACLSFCDYSYERQKKRVKEMFMFKPILICEEKPMSHFPVKFYDSLQEIKLLQQSH